MLLSHNLGILYFTKTSKQSVGYENYNKDHKVKNVCTVTRYTGVDGKSKGRDNNGVDIPVFFFFFSRK